MELFMEGSIQTLQLQPLEATLFLRTLEKQMRVSNRRDIYTDIREREREV